MSARKQEPEGVAVARAFLVSTLIGLAFWIAVGGGFWAFAVEVMPCAR